MPIRNLPSDPSLENLKNRAKTLQRRVRNGDGEALGQVREFHPRASALDLAGFTRADAQLMLARMFGFASWPRLRQHLDLVTRYSRAPHRALTGGSARDEFLRLACLTYGGDSPERWAEARQILADHPEVATADIFTMAAAGAVGAARELVERDPGAATRQGGPHQWEPLLYAVYSRIDSRAPGHSTLEVARLLLDHGADPNAGYLWEGLPSPFTALTGAFGEGEDSVNQPRHQYSAELARLLLERGADANDNQTLYNRQFNPANDHLELLFEFGLGHGSGGPWQARMGHTLATPTQMVEDQLTAAARNNFVDRVRLLLSHGVDPNGRGTGHPILEGRSAYELAVLNGNAEIAELLADAGAERPQLDEVQRFLAAAMRADRDRVTSAAPDLVDRARAAAPGAIVDAADLQRPDAVRLLVELGFDVNALKGWGALHAAASHRDLEMAKLLLDLGADPARHDLNYDATALGWAEHFRFPEMVDYLAGVTPPSESP